MKYSLLVIALTSFTMLVSAQKKVFDIVTYTIPGGWSEQKTAGHVSHSRTDNGNWAQITIYKSAVSAGTADADFDKDWNELVAANKVISSPQKTKPQSAEGWTVISGSGTWQYNGANVTSLLTVYSNEQVYISVICNATAISYFKDYQTLLASFILNAANAQTNAAVKNGSDNNGATTASATNSITGLWIVNEAETRGFVNGHLMYTGGYIRKEYKLNKDGTYVFRIKTWLASNETIYFVYESGTWSLKGNQLTITPQKGKAGWWNKDKVSNDVNKWGSFQKAAAYKLQAVTYNVEIKTDPNYSNAIVLNTGKPTERDGGQFNNPPYRFPYVSKSQTLIDNPPGFKF